MIRAHGAVKAILVVDLEHPGHVGRAVVVEGLAEMLARAHHVAKVHEEDLLSRAELLRQGPDILAHQLEIRLAEGDSISRARHDVHHFAVIEFLLMI